MTSSTAGYVVDTIVCQNQAGCQTLCRLARTGDGPCRVEACWTVQCQAGCRMAWLPYQTQGLSYSVTESKTASQQYQHQLPRGMAAHKEGNASVSLSSHLQYAGIDDVKPNLHIQGLQRQDNEVQHSQSG